MNFVIIFNNFMTFLSLVLNICFLLPLIYNIYKYLTQKRYIKKILSYNNKPVQIYQSVYTYNTIEGNVYDFITYEYLECLDNILNIFNLINQKYSFINQIDNARNEICIGGFMHNKRTNAYFVKYFSGFRFYVNEKYKNDYEKYPIDTQVVIYTKDKTGFKISKNKFLETKLNKIDYAFLIKLTPDDFKDKCEKTVHILFGGRSISTIKATEYLMTQYNNIYDKYKNNHYFFAIEINLIDNSINHKKGIMDLTEDMFH